MKTCKNQLIGAIAAVLLLACLAFVPSLTDFNSTQFDTSGNKVSFRPGAAVTNSTINVTNLYSVTNFSSYSFITNLTAVSNFTQVGYITNLYSISNFTSVAFVTNLTVQTNITLTEYVTNLYVTQSYITNLTVITNDVFQSYITNLTVNNQYVTNLTVTTNLVQTSYITNLYSTTSFITNLTVNNFFSLTNAEDNLTVTNGVTNLALSASQFVKTDANKRLGSTLDGGALTGLTAGNIIGGPLTNALSTTGSAIAATFKPQTNSWAGSTNTLSLANIDQYFTASTDCEITGVTGKDTAQSDPVILTITNSASTNITVWLSRFKSGDGSRSFVITNATIGVLSFKYEPVFGSTNFVSRNFY